MTWVQTRIRDFRTGGSTFRSWPPKPGKHLSLYKSSNSYCTGDLSQMGQTHGNSQYLQLLDWRHFLGQGVWSLLSLEAAGNSNIFLALSWFPAPQVTMLKTEPDFHFHFQAELTWATGQSHPILCACNVLGIKGPASETKPKSPVDGISWL